MANCPLCNREVKDLSDHHLVPRSRGGQETLSICLDCHNSVHAFFTNKELEKEYNSADALLQNEKFAKHIKWLSKQPSDKRFKTDRVKYKNNRGRSG